MARWKLKQPHYLKVPGTLWEYQETDRATGRPLRKQFPVPRYFHHEDPTDWNYITGRDAAGRAVEGDIVVCHEGKGLDKDYTFTGPPTPDMEPMDDEAREISSKLGVGAGFLEEMPDGGYAGRVLEVLSERLAQAMTDNKPAASTVNIEKLLESNNKLMEQMAALIVSMANPVQHTEKGRRV